MKNKINILIFSLLAVLTLAGTIIWNLLGVDTIDDFYYHTIVRNNSEFWDAQSDLITNFVQAWQSVIGHVSCINGRLANLIHILFQPLPREVEAIFLSVFLFLMWLCLQYCAKTFSSKSILWGAIVTTLLIWIGLPWHDRFQSLNFQINYILPSAFCLFVAGSLNNIDQIHKNSYILFLVLSYFTGWLHEGYTVLLMIFILSHLMFCIKNRRVWCIFIAVVLGLATDFYLGTYTRTQSHLGRTDYNIYSQFLIQLCIQEWPLFVCVALFILKYSLSKKDGQYTLCKHLLPYVLTGLAGFAMCMISRMCDRVIWPGLIFAFVPIIQISTNYLQNINTRLSKAFGIIFIILYGLWFKSVIDWQYKTADETHEVMTKLSPRDTKSSNVEFNKITDPDKIPWYLFGVSNQRLYDSTDLASLFGYYNRRRTGFIIAPPEFKGLKAHEWDAIPGNAGLYGRWPLVVRTDSVIATLDFVFGKPENMSPADLLLSALKYENADTIHARIPYWLIPLHTSENEIIWRVNLCEYSRTAHHRPLLRIDTIKPGA